MIKIMLLAMMATVTPTIESSDRGITVTVDAPESGHYTGCWLTVGDDTNREPEEVRENCWLFPGEKPNRGIITLVHCTDDGCNLIDIPFGDPPAERGILVAVAAALGAGLLMNFMPCVLPVIGLKLRAFADPRKRWSYIAGVMCSFMVLATLSLFLGTGLSLMGFGHYRMTLSVVCFLFGLSLLGVWNIPTFGVSGNLGPFGMGILTVALGSSCAVPFLAPAMAYCASCSVPETYIIFAALGGGFCSPFILPLARFMSFSRHYLPLIEKGCACLLIAVSVWVFTTLSHDLQGPTLMLTGSILGILTLVTRPEVSTRKSGSSVMVRGFVVSGLCGLFWLYQVGQGTTVAPQVIPSLDEPQVTFVTAEWCMNCAAMKLTLHDEEVVSRMAELGLVPKFLDYTDRSPQVRDFLTASYSTDVPVLRIVGVTGNVTILRGVWTPASILAALE